MTILHQSIREYAKANKLTIPEARNLKKKAIEDHISDCANVTEIRRKIEKLPATDNLDMMLILSLVGYIFNQQQGNERMTNAITKPLAGEFRQMCNQLATSLLTDWVGQERAGEAIGRVSCAISAAAANARNPADVYACTPQSVGAVIAIAALTGIMPGTGRTALAYAIPRRARQGEAPQLRYELSHRGIAVLARRSGQSVVAIPISHTDEIEADEMGSVKITHRDIDNPPETMDDLRGVMVVVTDIASGQVVSQGWVAKKIILKRRDGSDAYKYAEGKDEWAKSSDPWHAWPIEQAMKTGLHYAVARGWCVIDDTNSMRALAADSGGDVESVEPALIENQSLPVGKVEIVDGGFVPIHQPNYIDLIDTAKDTNELDAIWSEFLETKPTAGKKKTATQAFDARVDELSQEIAKT